MFDNFKIDVEVFTMAEEATDFQRLMPFSKN